MGGVPSSLECYGELQRVSSEKLGETLEQTVHKLCKCSEIPDKKQSRQGSRPGGF